MMVDYSLVKLASEIKFEVEDYSPLLKLFVDTTDSNLAEISSAIEVLNSNLISPNIHNIKGAALNLGLEKIAGIVEQMSRLNKDSFFTDIEVRVAECKAELTKLRRLLE